MGTRLDPVSSRSQIRHPAGKNTLTSVSLNPVSQAHTPCRLAKAFPSGEFASAMQAEIYTSWLHNQRENVR
jgi:hypothetical protein